MTNGVNGDVMTFGRRKARVKNAALRELAKMNAITRR